MTLITQTGHYSNISNFEKAIAICSNFRENFAPCNVQIKISNMMQKWHAVIAAETSLQNLRDENRLLVTKREHIFKALGKKITRVLGLVESLHESYKFKKEVKILANKIRGFKMSAVTFDGSTSRVSYFDAPQLSFIQRTENFQRLIGILSASSLYIPNEEKLTTQYLQNEQLEMQALNDSIAISAAAIAEARMIRDQILYDEKDGLLSMMKACKSYVKGLYGASSEEYRSLSILKFRKKPVSKN